MSLNHHNNYDNRPVNYTMSNKLAIHFFWLELLLKLKNHIEVQEGSFFLKDYMKMSSPS